MKIAFMLTHDDSVMPNMSVEHSNLQRSSWKAEAIRRGDLKISGPIPITEDMPLNEEEENEFEKHGTLSPSPPHDVLVDQPTQHTPVQPPDPPVITAETTSVEQPEIREQHRISSPRQLAVRMQPSPEGHRRSATEPVLIRSPIPPTPDTPTRALTSRKRKSGLRNVFRKMFGRKGREGAGAELEDEVQPMQRSQTQSQSQRVSDTAMVRASSERRPLFRRERISNLPVEEPTPLNPLGQHLPFPMNVNAPQENSPPNEYLKFEVPTPDFSRRRATLPNVHAVTETQSLNGTEKRPEAWEEQHDGEFIPSPEIGVALSSPPHALQDRRKSRSAGDLRELVKGGRLSVDRRRSAEIRHWRSSYASASVYSTNTPRPRTAQTVETVRSTETTNDFPELKNVVTKSVSVHAPTVVSAHDPVISQIQHPVEAFNFGNLRSDFSDDEETTDDHRAPLPAPAQERRISIEDRVKHLEENMRSLDASVRRMSGYGSRQTIILENAPKGRRSRNRSSSASSQRQGSHHSSTVTHNGTALHLREYGDAPSPAESPVHAHAPLSAVTELPTSTLQDPIPATTNLQAQFVALQQSLQHERHARQALEAQVEGMQRDIADLHALVHKFVGTSPNYPTPSPDGIRVVASREESTPRASGVMGDNGRGEFVRRGRGESESSMESEGVSPAGENWATPKESIASGFF